jgi:hypothetical protein
MFSSNLFFKCNHSIDIRNGFDSEVVEAYLTNLCSSTGERVGFVYGLYLLNEKKDLSVDRAAALALFRVMHNLRVSRPSVFVGLKLYSVSDKPRKVVVNDELLARSGLPTTLITWPASMEKRVEDSITITRKGIVWSGMNFCFSNFQGHALERTLSDYVPDVEILFRHLPAKMFSRKMVNGEFVIQCLAKTAKCLEFPADISDAKALEQFVKNCASVGFELEIKDAAQLANGEKHRLYSDSADTYVDLVRMANHLILERMFECTDSKEFKKFGNALNFHKNYFDDTVDGKFSVAHGAPFALGGIVEDGKMKLGLNSKVQALVFLLRMAEDSAFASFCEELTALEVQICENAGHFRGAEGEKFVYDDTKFGCGFGSQIGPDQHYTKNGKPVVAYNAMGHGYSIACTLFETGGESFGDGYKFRDSFLSGASTRDDAIRNLIVDIFSPAKGV